MEQSEERVEHKLDGNQSQKLTDWAKEPTILDLKNDLEAARSSHQAQMTKISRWNDLAQVKGSAKPKKVKGRSSVQPKLIRRQAEWRYSALTEPFNSSQDLFKIKPRTFEDGDAARKNELVLNYQFSTAINRIKFIDDLVRTNVDEGTAFVRVGWNRQTIKVLEDAPVFAFFPLSDNDTEQVQILQQAVNLMVENPREYEETADDALKAAVEYWEETGKATYAQQTGTRQVEVEKVIVNQPEVKVFDPNNVIVDPSHDGDLDKAMFAVFTSEVSKAELLKEGDKYQNLDKVMWDQVSPGTGAEPDHASKTPGDFQFKDTSRKKVVAYEYWGFYDTEGDGTLRPIIVTWIGDVIIRMEENPFPDGKIPLVHCVYNPVKRELYGEPDAELLEDNQKILGALVRGMIDLMGRSANSQQGFAKGMLDPLNRRRFESGQDYEFNPNMPTTAGHITHKYPEIPQSAMLLIGNQNQEAEALTGVKSFAGGLSGSAYGEVAAGIRGVLDAASKREMAILRRVARCVSEVGEKIVAMNALFLSEEEQVRITNEEFETIRREDLAGNFDLKVDISTAEIDNAQVQDLAFILQTVGPNTDLGIILMILSEICRLKKLPELAEKVAKFQPQQNPLEQKRLELEIEKLQEEIYEIKSRRMLNEAKAREADAKSDAEELGSIEKAAGVEHGREMERIQSQARGNQQLQVTKALTTPRKEGDQTPNIEAAIGYNELTDRRDDVGGPAGSL